MFRGRVRPLRIGRVRVRVEVADSILTRAVGLMFRRFLAPDAGVLLCFPSSRNHALHMWWVRFPLDILLLDEAGRIMKIVHAAPGQWPFAPGVPVRFALEVNAGFCRRHRIRPGMTCRLPVSGPARA